MPVSPEKPNTFPVSWGDIRYWAQRIFNPRDSINVEIQDQHSEVVDLLMYQELDTFTLLQDQAIGDRSIQIETTGVVVPTTAHHLCFKEGQAFLQAGIISVTPIVGNQYTVIIDQPLDYPYTTAGGCSIQNVNLALADGSTTPQTFYLSPIGLDDTVEWDITRGIIVFIGPGPVSDPEPDDTRFGTIAALTNGIVLRAVNGFAKNLFNAKTNADMKLRCGSDLFYTDANKKGDYSVIARRTFNGFDKNGVTIRMCAKTEDKIEVIIQDDLTDMTTINVNVQGHVVQTP